MNRRPGLEMRGWPSDTSSCRALGGAPGGFRLGLAVLQRQGMAAWIGAWEEIGGAPPSQRPTQAAHGSDAVVAVLASMALAVAGAG